MSDQKQILEQYLKVKLTDKAALSIIHLDKLADGWESDNYLLSVEYGVPRTQENWVWRIYSGVGRQAKAVLEFSSMKKLHAIGYPVPHVFLLEVEDSPVARPFVIMEYIQGEVMWHLLDKAPVDEQKQLIDQFCRLFVQLHELDWRQFDDDWLDDTPYYYIDRWLDEARRELRNFPDINAAPFLEWVIARRELFTCTHPSPVHLDFHPGNVLVKPDHRAMVIDWTQFRVSDSRFDLAWTLVLTHAHGFPGLRDQILKGYQRHAGKLMDQIEAFEAVASARRLFSLAVSLTQGAGQLGMNAQAVESIRATMDAHRRVYRLFTEHTGLQIKIFDSLFGKSG